MVIGITGLYCCGKSSMAKKLEDFLVINTDELSHLALKENRCLIAKTFGLKIDENENINRKELAKIVFKDKKKLKELEDILHPVVIQNVKDIVLDCENYTIESALLFESKLCDFCDFIFFIDTNVFIRFFRALKRDKLGFWQTFLRFFAQRNFKKHILSKIDNKRVYRINSLEDISNILISNMTGGFYE